MRTNTTIFRNKVVPLLRFTGNNVKKEAIEFNSSFAVVKYVCKHLRKQECSLNDKFYLLETILLNSILIKLILIESRFRLT